jgi:enoyl-CoA hydratase/carnithine racemase
MEGKHVTLVKEGKIGIIRFNKPKANTYNYEMMQEFNQAVEAVRFDEGVHVAVLTSSVPNFFSAGADIEMLRSSDPDYKAMFCLFCQEALSRMESTPKVFISAINGHCVGGWRSRSPPSSGSWWTTRCFSSACPWSPSGCFPGAEGPSASPGSSTSPWR